MFVWICFFSFYELFPASICGNITGSLVNSFFWVPTLIPIPSCTSFSTHSSGGIVHHLILETTKIGHKFCALNDQNFIYNATFFN